MLPLLSCTFNFIVVPLSGSCKVTADETSAELVLQQSVLDHYALCEGLADTNMYHFAANYIIVRDHWTRSLTDLEYS